MIFVARNDTSVIGRWWWTVDRWMLAAVLIIMAIGVMLTMTASPAVAERIHVDGFYFVRHQIMYLVPAIGILFSVSLLNPMQVRRLAAIVFILSIIAVMLTIFIGVEIKGARRWLSLGFISLQPSEFLKPSFFVVSAWLFAEQRNANGQFKGDRVSICLLGIILSLLLLQPDLGMSTLVSVVWFGQFFLAGLPFVWVILFMVLGVGGLFGAYATFDHVKSRIDRFLDPSTGDTYQVEKSLEAFMSGGVMGRGPGEGVVKNSIPDVHADFIFAVVGEELGLFAALLIIGFFAFIVVRGYNRLLKENDLFIVLAAAALIAQFGLQALVNMGSTVQLIPAKGMTLPFISYGGSSLLSMAFGMGMVLALTRRKS